MNHMNLSIHLMICILSQQLQNAHGGDVSEQDITDGGNDPTGGTTHKVALN